MSGENYSQEQSADDGWTIQVSRKKPKTSWQTSPYENDGSQQDTQKQSYNNNNYNNYNSEQQSYDNDESNASNDPNSSEYNSEQSFQNRRKPPRATGQGISPTSPAGYVYQPYVLPSSQFKDKGANQLSRPYTFWFVDKNQASEELQQQSSQNEQQSQEENKAEGEGASASEGGDDKTKANANKKVAIENYEDYLKKIGDFSSAEGFWGFYSHVKRCYSLPNGIDFQMFRFAQKFFFIFQKTNQISLIIPKKKKTQTQNSTGKELIQCGKTKQM